MKPVDIFDKTPSPKQKNAMEQSAEPQRTPASEAGGAFDQNFSSERTLERPSWALAGHRYYPLGLSMREEFGEPVWKISIDAKFSCPNVDGTVSRSGCIFCNNISFSPSRRLGIDSIKEQIAHGVEQNQRRHKVSKFIAYFQPSTNTYGPLDYLEKVYREAAEQPCIVGLAIGTRPDAVSEPVLDLIADLSKKYWISLELGIQTSKNETLKYLNRGHDFQTSLDAVARIKRRSLRFGIHLILGLPGESRADMIRTAEIAGIWNPNSIKLHHLYVVKETALARLWEQGEVQLSSAEEYAEYAVDCLERLSPQTVIDRLSGQMSPEFLIAPAWTAEKHLAGNLIKAALVRRQTWQGRLWSNPREEKELKLS